MKMQIFVLLVAGLLLVPAVYADDSVPAPPPESGGGGGGGRYIVVHTKVAPQYESFKITDVDFGSKSQIYKTLDEDTTYTVTTPAGDEFELVVLEASFEDVKFTVDGEEKTLKRYETEKYDLNGDELADININYIRMRANYMADLKISHLSDGGEFDCEDEGAVRERVKCRLSRIKETGEYAVSEHRFNPEECRLKVSQISKKACIQKYKDFANCMDQENDIEKFRCAKSGLGIGKGVPETVRECQSLQGSAMRNCVSTLKTNVDNTVMFRLYNLEQKANGFLERGADEELVSEFVFSLEEKKKEYYISSEIDAKKEILLDVRAIWKEFIQQVKSQMEVENEE